MSIVLKKTDFKSFAAALTLSPGPVNFYITAIFGFDTALTLSPVFFANVPHKPSEKHRLLGIGDRV